MYHFLSSIVVFIKKTDGVLSSKCLLLANPMCQVATWNDYNEGQHVQPSWWCDGKNDPEQFLREIRNFQMGQSS